MGIFRKYVEYANDNPQGLWFKKRPFGWGWVPVKKQGWAVLGLYILAVTFFALTIDENSSTREVIFTFLLPVALLTATLIRICYMKGERPTWSWGFPDTDNKDGLSQ